MSDPFPPLEAELGVSRSLLRELASTRYPTIISTKGVLLAEDRYLELLREGDFVVQVSFSARDDRLAAELDRGAPSPTERIQMLRDLSRAGISTAARLQPLLPGREEEAAAFIAELADAGVRHVGVEYLKLPVERWRGTQRMSQAVGVDLGRLYSAEGAERSAREWLLPATRRLESIVSLRAETHACGMSFGAADTDLLPLGDGACCCSGAEVLLKTAPNFLEFNYLGAVRRASASGQVSFNSLSDCWVPGGSIAEMVNSESRLPSRNGRGAELRDYIRANWNGRPNGCSPQMFYGVEPTGSLDDQGLRIYALTDELRTLMVDRLGNPVH
nr:MULTISPECIES: radical SAM protein [unclassified Mycobacterium]